MHVTDERTGKQYDLEIKDGGVVSATDFKKVGLTYPRSMGFFRCNEIEYWLGGAERHFALRQRRVAEYLIVIEVLSGKLKNV